MSKVFTSETMHEIATWVDTQGEIIEFSVLNPDLGISLYAGETVKMGKPASG